MDGLYLSSPHRRSIIPRPERALSNQLVHFRYHPRMSESSYLAVGDHVGLLLGTVRCEKVGAREAQILEKEIDGLAPARGWRIVLDMSDVTMVASMGLGLLVSVHKKAKGGGGSLVICNLRPELLQLLQLTHLHKVLKIVADKNTALKTLA